MSQQWEPPKLLGTWTAPSGRQVDVFARVVVNLTYAGEPLDPDDSRWFVEEVVPQLTEPVKAMVQLDLTKVRWQRQPPTDEAAEA